MDSSASSKAAPSILNSLLSFSSFLSISLLFFCLFLFELSFSWNSIRQHTVLFPFWEMCLFVRNVSSLTSQSFLWFACCRFAFSVLFLLVFSFFCLFSLPPPVSRVWEEKFGWKQKHPRKSASSCVWIALNVRHFFDKNFKCSFNRL